jgi:mRNA interferase MazF
VAGLTFPRRGEVYWTNLDPAFGAEIAKTRPAVVVSNDLGNEHSPRVIVAPITSRWIDRVRPFEALLPAGEGGLSQASKALLNQVRTLDKRRLGQRIGAVTPARMQEVDRALRLSLAL